MVRVLNALPALVVIIVLFVGTRRALLTFPLVSAQVFIFTRTLARNEHALLTQNQQQVAQVALLVITVRTVVTNLLQYIVLTVEPALSALPVPTALTVLCVVSSFPTSALVSAQRVPLAPQANTV